MIVKPWYKQFWPWFLILLPATVVCWTIITVMVFSQHSVSLVTEDYYKKGKGINIDLSKMEVAKALRLRTNVISTEKQVVIELDKGTLHHFPALQVMFAHRTLPDRDFTQLLTADAKGRYRFVVEQALQGPWFIELTPYDQSWLIQGKVTFPSAVATPLSY